MSGTPPTPTSMASLIYHYLHQYITHPPFPVADIPLSDPSASCQRGYFCGYLSQQMLLTLGLGQAVLRSLQLHGSSMALLRGLGLPNGKQLAADSGRGKICFWARLHKIICHVILYLALAVIQCVHALRRRSAL